MAKGILNIQAADGAVIGLHVPDGLTSGERPISLGVNLSGITAYHLLQGNLAVSASAITQGFNTTLYTSGSATTGIDMDTQWGNTAEEKFGGLVWLKDRVEATNNFLYDTVRGATKEINSNTTEAEATLASGLTAFNSTGFTVGADTGHNSTTNNMVSWNFQTTHRVTGTTNHGKAYTCHYNPFTGFTIVKYEGSGLAGHEIPHHLGRKLGLVVRKNLSAASDWVTVGTVLGDNGFVFLNLTTSLNTSANIQAQQDNSTLCWGAFTDNNAASNQYILYGWANSYFDESNKLIGNYEIGVCQGTGAAGNKVTTRGKPAWIKIKRLDAANDWQNHDNQRNSNYILQPNTNSGENTGAGNEIAYLADGFSVNGTGTGINASGGQYLYLVAYDTNSNGGGSYYPLASDTSNLQIQNAIIPFANGVDTNGTKITTLSKNETISGLTLTAGKNYVYSKNDGTYGVSKFAPQYNSYNGFGDYFDVASNKWYSGVSVFSDTCDITTNWTADEALGGAASTISSVNGELKIVNNGATYGAARTSITTIVGKKYKLVYSLTSNSSGTANFWVGSTLRGQDLGTNPQASAGTYSITFTASTSTTYLMAFNQNNSGAISTWDNIAVYPIKNDGTQDLSNATAITTSRNYLNHIVYADNDGGVLYVEELPKIEYIDTMQVDDLKVLSGFDLGQTWKDVTASRSAGVTYTNTTGKPIQVMITTAGTDTSHYVFSATVNGVQISYVLNNYTIPYWCFIVPQGHTYSVTSGKALSKWSELR